MSANSRTKAAIDRSEKKVKELKGMRKTLRGAALRDVNEQIKQYEATIKLYKGLV